MSESNICTKCLRPCNCKLASKGVSVFPNIESLKFVVCPYRDIDTLEKV
jgi:hypothetical protein